MHLGPNGESKQHQESEVTAATSTLPRHEVWHRCKHRMENKLADCTSPIGPNTAGSVGKVILNS